MVSTYQPLTHTDIFELEKTVYGQREVRSGHRNPNNCKQSGLVFRGIAKAIVFHTLQHRKEKSSNASEMEQEYGEKVSLTYPSHLAATERKFVMDSARLAITGCDFPMDNNELERFTNSFIINLQQKNAAFIESLSREETVRLALEMFVGLPEEARKFMRQQAMNMSDEEFENHRDAAKTLDVDAIRDFVRGAARPMMGK